MRQFLLLFMLFSTGVPAFATIYYVSEPTGNNSYNGTSTATAFKTIQKAADVSLPGDVINVMNGTYTNSCAQCNVVTITRPGNAANWITFQNYAGHAPVLQFTGWQAFGLGNNAAYIRITGFEIIGNNANVTLADALNQPRSCANPGGSPNPIYNGNGISADGRTLANRPHHLYFGGNIVHDCGGAGISAIQCDYVTIEDNIIYNNSWYTIYGTSGISLLQLWNSDGSITTHNFIRRNRCFGNRLYVPWAAVCDITDGNGIIIDDSKNTQGGSTLGAYTAATLVENNVVWNNGGSGIHTYKSEHVTIIHNTAYQNSQSTETTGGEIFANNSNDIKIINNIMWAADGNTITTNSSNTGLTYDYNLHWGGTGTSLTGIHTITANPNFAAPDLILEADFHLLANSPAINTGDNANSSATDHDGTARPFGATVDMGAYEKTGALPVEYLAPLQGRAVAQQGIELCWATAVEQNTSRFDIERSADGIRWTTDAGREEVIGAVAAQGSSTAAQSYIFWDKNPLYFAGRAEGTTNYYRLRQIDRDGKAALSNVVAVSWKPTTISIFPNPVTDIFTVKSEMDWERSVLKNALGQTVRTFSFSETMTLTGLASGTYSLEIFAEKSETPTVLRVVKQ